MFARLILIGVTWLAATAVAHGGEVEPAGDLGVRVPGLGEKLSALSPAEPMAYFLLGEEVLVEARSEADLALARTLLVLAHEADRRTDRPRGLSRSVYLALASIARDENERRWLRALAEESVRGPIVPRQGVGEEEVRPEALALAEAIGHWRAGDSRAARESLRAEGVSRLIERVSASVSGASEVLIRLEQDVSCSGCRNRGIVRSPGGRAGAGDEAYMLCPLCRGNPGPRLSAGEFASSLAAESVLVRSRHGLWSAQVWLDGGRPLREPDADALAATFGVSPEKSVWRPRAGAAGALDGEWVSPAEAGE